MRLFHSLTLVIGLSACVTTPNQDFVSQADQLIGQTKAACQFIPTVSAVAALLTGGATANIGTIAAGVCSEVNKLPRLEADEAPQSVTVDVGGIAVDGLLY